jgi:CheY-like chemotaxis protein
MNIDTTGKTCDKPLILIVDDSSSERMLMRAALEKGGFSVLELDSAEKLFPTLESVRPDLIVLDIEMPGMNGFEACRKLRHHPRFVNLPVLICTGQQDIESIEKAFEAGATDFFTKPNLFHLLPHRVSYLLRSSKTDSQLRDTLARQGAILDSFSGYIYSSSSDYRIEYVNDRLLRKSGGDRVGDPCYQVVFGLEEKCPWCVAEDVFKGETVRQEIKLFNHAQWFNIVNTPLRHSDGRISHHALFYDISNRKNAEENLRKSQKEYKELFQQFHTLLNGIPDSISLLDPDKNVVWANESTTRLWGGEGKDLPGKSCREYLGESSDLCRDCPVNKKFLKIQP